jgi:predicted esterase
MTAADPHGGQPVVSAGPEVTARSTVMILVHGRNAGPENILDLAPHFADSTVTYLAPTAAGHTWYPMSFLAPRNQNEPFLSSALAALEHVVDDVARRGVPLHRIIVGGFSQGACLATEFVYRHAKPLGGLVAFSGGLIGPPGTTWDRTESLHGMPAFFGCSDVDAHVPRVRVEESAAVFATLGAEVTPRIYPGMGHTVNDDEIAHATALIAAVGGTR